MTKNKKITQSVLSFSLILFIFILQSPGAVTIDNVSTNGIFKSPLDSGVSNLNWLHTVGTTGGSQALFVGISTTGSGGLSPVCNILIINDCSGFPLTSMTPSSKITDVSYDGITMNSIGTVVSPDFNNTVEIFVLTNPPQGIDKTINVNFTPLLTTHAVGGAVSFNGVNQTTPNGTFFPSSQNNSTPTVVVSDPVAGDLVFDTIAISPNGQFLSPDSSQMGRWLGKGNFFNSYDVGAGSTEAAMSTVTMSWTITGSDLNHALAGVAVKSLSPSAASGEISGRVLTTDGRGIPRISISLTTGNGKIITARTNPFGYFRFNDLEIGNTYILQPKGKRYVFAPSVVTLDDSIADVVLYPVGK